MKFLNLSSATTCIYLKMALLLELVKLLVMIVPVISPSVGATGQRKHPRYSKHLLVALIIFLFLLKLTTRSTTSLLSRDLLDGDATALTAPALQMKLSRKCTISLTNQTYFSVYLVSMIFSSQLQTTHVQKTKPIKKLKP